MPQTMRKPLGTELDELLDSDDPRTLAEMKAQDRYDEGIVTDAKLNAESTTWSISWRETPDESGSYGCGCPAKDGITIMPGDRIKVYSPFGFGSTFHGIDINDAEMFWRTPLERIAKRVEWLAQHDREKRTRFDTERNRMDNDYDSLPAAFKARIDRFRSESPAFRIDSEAYEMAAVKDAALFAARAREMTVDGEPAEVTTFWAGDWRQQFSHPDATEPADPAIRWLGWWWALNGTLYGYDHDRQTRLMPGMNAGHSGNTFGAACSLAWRHLEGKPL